MFCILTLRIANVSGNSIGAFHFGLFGGSNGAVTHEEADSKEQDQHGRNYKPKNPSVA
jgi:hypothetical protein